MFSVPLCAPAARPGCVLPLAPAHLPGLQAVQRACYGASLLESTAVFARRLGSAANCSLALADGDQVQAYALACHAQQGQLTPLHGDFVLVAQPDTVYLHDMAVHPDWAGRGLARQLLQVLWAQARARRLRFSALVSVQGSQPYWQRQGYAVQPLASAAQAAQLAGYGADAVYMVQRL